jgi:putative serine protease PepD
MFESGSRGRRVLRVSAPIAAAAAVGAGVVAGIDRTGDRTDEAGTTVTVATRTVVIPASTTASTTLDATEIYSRTAPGVVDIEVAGSGLGPFEQGGTSGEGSGFVVDAKGHIVTNAHVVSGASSITVAFADGSHAKATLVGSDESTDVAVVKVSVPASKLHALPLGSSAGLKPGQGVVAIGSPFGLPGSITAGIVSAVHRTITSPNGARITGAIQTDAALNRGNSGGPLLDSAGKVIGVNAQIESNTGAGAGVGFAIPIETARAVTLQLIGGGTVRHGFLGVQVNTVTAAASDQLGLPEGAQVTGVEPGSPAAKAGLKAGNDPASAGSEYTKDGDVIVTLNGATVRSGDDLAASISVYKPGEKVTLGVVRSGDRRTVVATLGRRPD